MRVPVALQVRVALRVRVPLRLSEVALRVALREKKRVRVLIRGNAQLY